MGNRVSVRFPPEVMDALQFLVDRGDYPSLSSAVESAVDSLIHSTMSPEDLVASIGCREVDSLELQDAVLEDSLRDAVRVRLGADADE